MAPIITLFIISTILQIVMADSSNVYWKNVTLSQVVLESPEPAGLINGENFIYVCRAQRENDNRWVSGSLIFSEDKVASCNIERHGSNEITNFQILISPPGTLSWVPFSGKTPENAIEGGTHGFQERVGYVCRAPYQNSLLIGMTGSDGWVEHRCHIAYDGQQIFVDSPPEKLEILTRNQYSKFLDENFPKS